MTFLATLLKAFNSPSKVKPVALAGAEAALVRATHLVPAEWMPAAPMKRIILHWTGGSYVASSLDKEHYHFLIDGDLRLIRGKHPVTANVAIGSKTSDHYAAHTKGANTGSIGVSICSMAEAQDRPGRFGKYPLTEAQWQRAAETIAELCKRYGIPVTDKTVLTHAEVQTNLGIKQNGKWDIARLPFNQSLVGAKACGDDLRRRIKEALK